MKIDPSNASNVQVSNNSLKKGEKNREKKSYSSDEIRKKVNDHFGNKTAATPKATVASPPPPSTAQVDQILLNNDPKNPETIKKLREALESGVVNFNGSERRILEKIIQPENKI